MIIYKVTNLINSKVYIGQTINSLNQRWVHHCGKWSSCTYLRNAIQKYGKENFTIEEIDRAETLDILNEREIYWIEFYETKNPDKGYNLRFGGNNSTFSEESKKKMSISSTGKKHSEETKKKMSEMRKNMSEETKRKMSETRKGRPLSKEASRKIQEKRKGWKMSEADKLKTKISQRRRRLKDQGINVEDLTDDQILEIYKPKYLKKS